MRNEFAKLRHLQMGSIAAVMVSTIVGLTFVGTVSNASASDATDLSWALPLGALSLAFPVISPLLIAVIASRTVEVEHQGSGWLLNQSSGIDRGRLVRAKLLTTGLIVGGTTTLASILTIVIGTLLGIAAPLPTALWLGYTAAIVVVNLVILALNLLISAVIDNQLIALGIGILGTVVAICASGFPSWLARLTPWGYYSLASAADYQEQQIVTLTPSYLSVAALGGTGIALFAFFTLRLDRQEVRS